MNDCHRAIGHRLIHAGVRLVVLWRPRGDPDQVSADLLSRGDVAGFLVREPALRGFVEPVSPLVLRDLGTVA